MATSFEYDRQAQTYDTTRAASPSVLGRLRAVPVGESLRTTEPISDDP